MLDFNHNFLYFDNNRQSFFQVVFSHLLPYNHFCVGNPETLYALLKWNTFEFSQKTGEYFFSAEHGYYKGIEKYYYKEVRKWKIVC